MKKVLIISTSLRMNSNSDILAKECERGARDAGLDVEYVSLKGKEIKYCIGCLSCQKTNKCVLKDDVADIMAKVKEAEVIVYATPIYYYEMSGQMKTLLDRLNPLYTSDYNFSDTTFDKAYSGLRGWVDCFENAELKGIVTGGGIDEAGSVNNFVDIKNKAYELGRGL